MRSDAKESDRSVSSYMRGSLSGLARLYVESRATSLPRYVLEHTLQVMFGFLPGPFGLVMRRLSYGMIVKKGSSVPFVEPHVELFYANQMCFDKGVYLDSGVRLHASKAEIDVGAGTRIMRGAYLCTYTSNSIPHEGISVGSECWIGVNSVLASGQGGITVADRVLVGPGVTIVTGGHNFRDVEKASVEQAYTGKPISIGSDVWVGANATILGGASVGSRSVVAAGAVVVDDVPDGTVVGGVPARPISEVK